VALLLALWPAGRLSAQYIPRRIPYEKQPRDFVVAFWYDKSDPVHTIQYQAYNLRKKQYDEKKVEAWADDVNFHYPGSRAVIRSITLDEWRGNTDDAKFQRALESEKNDVIARGLEEMKRSPVIVTPVFSPSVNPSPARRPISNTSSGAVPGSGGLSGVQPSIPPYLLNRPR
jgi:hypothetical protein